MMCLFLMREKSILEGFVSEAFALQVLWSAISKDCGKIQYLKQLDRFVFDEKKAFKIRPVVIWKNPEQKESISQQWFNALASKSPTL